MTDPSLDPGGRPCFACRLAGSSNPNAKLADRRLSPIHRSLDRYDCRGMDRVFYIFLSIRRSHAVAICMHLINGFIFLPVIPRMFMVSLLSHFLDIFFISKKRRQWSTGNQVDGRRAPAHRHVDPAAPPPTGTLTQCGPPA